MTIGVGGARSGPPTANDTQPAGSRPLSIYGRVGEGSSFHLVSAGPPVLCFPIAQAVSICGRAGVVLAHARAGPPSLLASRLATPTISPRAGLSDGVSAVHTGRVGPS